MKFLVLAVVIAAVAIATIWAINTLFPALASPLTFATWCAAVILGGLFSARLKG